MLQVKRFFLGGSRNSFIEYSPAATGPSPLIFVCVKQGQGDEQKLVQSTDHKRGDRRIKTKVKCTCQRSG